MFDLQENSEFLWVQNLSEGMIAPFPKDLFSGHSWTKKFDIRLI